MPGATPLPILGYPPHTREAVDLVNSNKVLEERVLRQLEAISANSENISIDGRWMAIAKTNIEQGFMALNRAIFQPGRVELSEDTQTATQSGWVLEAASSSPAAPQYFTADAAFSIDSLDALRFARRKDAEDYVASNFPHVQINFRIAEHQWG